MDDDFEDFLGLDSPASNTFISGGETSNPVEEDEEDERDFELPRQVQINPLNPTLGEEEEGGQGGGNEVWSGVQHEETPLVTSNSDFFNDDNEETDDGNTFDMDFLSVDAPIITANSPPFDITESIPDTDCSVESANPTGDTSPVTDGNKEPSAPSRSSLPESVANPEANPDDFMSWLDDKKKSPDVKSPLEVGKDGESTPSTKLMMDSFFDEVFGDDENSPLTLSGGVVLSTKNFESQLRKEISSAFCDANKIRNLILAAGYLPKLFRGQVWSILIGGSCNEDQEAEFWRPSGNEQVQNKEALLRDCAGVVQALAQRGTDHSPEVLQQTQADMADILLLHCMRRKRPYKRHHCSLLAPLLTTPLPASRALASACFYSLCTDFVPLINLTPGRFDVAVQKLSEWVRLLVSYHFPLLGLHLDRVFPGWECACLQPNAGEDVVGQSASTSPSESSASVDRDEESVAEASSGLSRASRQREEAGGKGGLVPSSWLSGIFGDSLPAEQACAVLDWAILNEERFFGVYFTASLFGLYGTALLDMNRAQISAWIAKVCSGCTGDFDGWFSLLPMVATPTLQSSNLLEDDADAEHGGAAAMDWPTFTRGWLHAATALWMETPAAFKESVTSTDLWAGSLAEDGAVAAADIVSATAALDKQREMDDSGSLDSKKAKMLKMKIAMEEKSRNVFKRLSKKVESVRKNSSGLEVDNLNRWEDDEDEGREWRQGAHVSKKGFRCLWAAAQEMVPSICSTQRKGGGSAACADSRDFPAHFCHGCEWTAGSTEFGVERRGGEGMSFPQLKDEQHNKMTSPMFFAVDIRSESEMRLGKFPKAFTLDPQFLSDPDVISSYLSTLEPVSEIAHLCIMGVGEEYIQAKVAASTSQGGGSSHSHSSLDASSTYIALLEEALGEYHATLMHVVVFFLKKGFRHVSILDGGFVAAARHLLRDDCCSTLGSALVDVFPPALDRILGEGVCARHLGVKKAAPPDLLSEHDAVGAPPLPTGATSSLGSSVNSALANFSSSSVGTNLGSFVSNLTAQVSSTTAASGSNDDGSGAVNSSATAAATAEEMGRRLSVFGSSALSSLRKTVSAAAGAPAPPPAANSPAPSSNNASIGAAGRSTASESKVKSTGGGGMQFVIDEDEDDDEEDDDEDSNRNKDSTEQGQEEMAASRLVDSIPDTTHVNVIRSEAEKAQALAMHTLAGVQKGDEVRIAKESLPGAVLFPALKDKLDKDKDGFVPLDNRGEPKTKQVHRFLVVTKERFIVLDSGGQGVGSVGVVKSNHHLTELIKITFKKKDPDSVILFTSSPGRGEHKPHSYKVAKRDDFIKTLQEKMKRFK